MKRKVPKLVSTLLITSLLAAGCGGGAPGAPAATSGNTESKAAEKKEPVKLKLSLWGDDLYKKTLEEMIEKFRQTNPNVSVEVILIPFTEYQQKLSIMLASKSGPDIGWMASRMIPQFMNSNQLLDVSSIEKDADYNIKDIYPSTLDYMRKDGKLYGVSFNAAPSVLFFNKTMFKEKGLKNPLELYKEGKWDYDQYLDVAKKLSDPAKGVYGLKLVKEWNNWYDILVNQIWAYGADIIENNGTKFLLNSPEGEKALQVYQDMIFKDKIHPKPGDQTAFESGNIAIYRDKYSYVRKAADIKNFEWDIAPLPVGPKKDAPVEVGTSAYAVFSDTKHPKEATELLKFLTNKESMTYAIKLLPPSRKSVQESDAFLKAAASPTPEGVRASILDKLPNSRVSHLHPNWQQIESKIQTNIDSLYTQSDSVKDILNRMDKEITPLLK
ncbi:ABC transporter substrate-binding protein [Paenibacillus thalictri]|uniref:Sugar ABC transporter substrate-binding protein n=1 Tax=Paenibacillus thalictri TaxID=2527873 RepID=A0A4Q9DMC7_9BACL|nr:sugar ABC transporter substrate-binding protein [Paenibacillus thalictri]TBL74573.1 sugar ABC transporter substrate-binding protein [Paenibacillus thalictri]